ncbi:MAG TPA: hypothetical protein VJ836_01590 [Candidatus Saccharimonadales bacterium]|nr:hypothetical protein [Candidatus Saccharimonadales bacterium]
MARTVKYYGFTVYGEGYQTGLLVGEYLTAKMPEIRAVSTFREWMGLYLGCFTLRDAARDIAEDAADGLIRFRPTLPAKIHLAVTTQAAKRALRRTDQGRTALAAMNSIKKQLRLPVIR